MNQLKTIMCFAILASSLLSAAAGSGQEVRLRPGDTVRLEVPKRDDLSRLLILDTQGTVSLPIVGKIGLDGLTIEEARATLLRALQELYPSVQSITLSLIGAEARTFIYVQGEVARPNKYDLSVAANLWDAIREAGGATANASLEAVRIIRAGEAGTATTTVNVQRALDLGDLSTMPPLRPGDTVIVPARGAASPAGDGSVLVVGAVVSPAPYNLGENKRLMDAILVAGGWTESAALGKVAVIHPLPQGGTQTTRYDVKKYLATGDARHNPVVFPGDTVNVPRRGSIFAILTNPTFIIGIITTATTLTLLLISQE